MQEQQETSWKGHLESEYGEPGTPDKVVRRLRIILKWEEEVVSRKWHGLPVSPNHLDTVALRCYSFPPIFKTSGCLYSPLN